MTREYVTVSRLLLVLALICFVLAVFSVSLPVNLMALGLVFFAGSFLLP